MSPYEHIFMVLGLFYIVLTTLPVVCNTLLKVVCIFRKAYEISLGKLPLEE